MRCIALALLLVFPVYASAQSLEVESLGVAAAPFPLTDELALLIVCEGEQGNLDLNGDADTLDDVLHLFHVPTRTLTNIGFDVTGIPDLEGDWLYFAVPESGQGLTDQNGDGDTFDDILHAYNLTTGELRSSGVSVAGGSAISAHIGRGFFDTQENDGIPKDWNGDGDTIDRVVMSYDPATDSIFSLGQAVSSNSSFAAAKDHALFFVSEFHQGNIDLNGDGDTSDFVLHAVDLTSLTLTNLGFTTGALQALESFVYCASLESGLGFDANEDGDTDDIILCIFDGEDGSFTVSGLSIELDLATPNGLAPGDDRFVVISNEKAAKRDWNDDGDISGVDDVAFLYDHRGKSLTNLGVAVDGFAGGAVGSDWVLLAVDEAAQGEADLNGDGDKLDRVLHRYGLIDGELENLGLSINRIDMDGAFGDVHAVILSEADEDVDWNGDGDVTDDRVGLILEASTNDMQVFGAEGLQSFPLASGSGPGFVAGTIWEAREGFTDLNGDGDVCDQVLEIALPCHGVRLSTGLAVRLVTALSFGNTIITVVDEARQSQDTNGDGDMVDFVIHLVTVDTASGASVSTADGLAGTAGFAPRLTIGTCPVAGSTTSLSLADGLGGAPAAIVTGTQAVSIKLFSQTLHVAPFELFWTGALGGVVGAGGAGGVRLDADLSNLALAGITLIAQAAVLDSAAPNGLLLTEALVVTVGEM